MPMRSSRTLRNLRAARTVELIVDGWTAWGEYPSLIHLIGEPLQAARCLTFRYFVGVGGLMSTGLTS